MQAHQGHFRGFPGGAQPLVEGFQHRVASHSRQGAHIQHGPHHGTATPGGASAPKGSTIAIHRRHPTRAAIWWRVRVPNSATSVRLSVGPTPGTPCSRLSRSRQMLRQLHLTATWLCNQGEVLTHLRLDAAWSGRPADCAPPPASQSVDVADSAAH